MFRIGERGYHACGVVVITREWFDKSEISYTVCVVDRQCLIKI